MILDLRFFYVSIIGIAVFGFNYHHVDMNAARIIKAKKQGERVSDADLAALIRGYAAGEVPDYQMAAFAMAIIFQGMHLDETVTLTREMRDSGKVMQWPDFDRPIVDKHSCGGIGDKISIPLAPMLASCGLAVPMISGRGLGPTGGTLDKLESIPGYRTDLSIEELQQTVRQVGCTITGTTHEIAPADRELYALRDITSTVTSVPLITASILSKKLAEGLEDLVLDVKWGSGTFMKTIPEAEELAESMVGVANRLGVKASALITDMNQPLGTVGNAIEIDESIEILKNEVDADTITLTIALGAELLLAAKVVESTDQAVGMLADSIRSGAAYETFERMVSAHGGDLNAPRKIAKEHVIKSDREGFIASVDAEGLGWAVIDLGGGRKVMGDKIDHSIGLAWLTHIGAKVERHQPLLSVFCSDDAFARVKSDLQKTITISDESVAKPDLIVKRISAS